MTRTFYLDAPSLFYRAFFALPTTITALDGRPVNAVRGFMEMTTRIIIDHRPDEIVAVFDSDYRPTFRVEAYPGYKIDRPDDPPELPAQFPMVAEVLDAAGIPRAEAEGLEADDAIATLVADATPDASAIVVSGDRDLLSLVRDGAVKVLFPLRGTKEMREFDEAAVQAAYGVPPRLYAQFAILRGDPSDGLPGIAGIGPKRAAALLERHGSIEGVVANLGDLPPRQRAAFESAGDYLEAMKTVVGLVEDADVRIDGGGHLDDDLMEELVTRYNLGSSGARLLQALRAER
jgi:5'-3' exonuclease